MIIDLRKPDLKNATLDTKVITSKGFTFTRTEDGWRDDETGLVWHYSTYWRGTHYEAQKKFGDKLPSKEQFEEAEKHGFREVLEIKSGWFWSSSVVPFNDDSAYDFVGYDGGIGNYYRSFINEAALCVSGGR